MMSSSQQQNMEIMIEYTDRFLRAYGEGHYHACTDFIRAILRLLMETRDDH